MSWLILLLDIYMALRMPINAKHMHTTRNVHDVVVSHLLLKIITASGDFMFLIRCSNWNKQQNINYFVHYYCTLKFIGAKANMYSHSKQIIMNFKENDAVYPTLCIPLHGQTFSWNDLVHARKVCKKTYTGNGNNQLSHCGKGEAHTVHI